MRYGYFDARNREYVIERPTIPVSWTNYLGVEELCTVISHHGGGYSFYRNAQDHRVTRFRANAVPMDRPGRYIYLRDEESGEYWSVSWQPVGRDLGEVYHRCRHGLSYTVFSASRGGVEAEQRVFIPRGDAVELWDTCLKNTGDTTQVLSLFAYVEFSFHHVDIDNQNFQMSLYAAGSDFADGVIEYDFHYEPGMFHYFTASFEPDGYDCVRDLFIGPYRSESNPVAVEKGECGGSSELGGNHCGALHKRVRLEPGEELRFVVMLGVGSREVGRRMRRKYGDPVVVDRAFQDLREYWERKLASFQCRTPHSGFDTMINTWTPYQAETCVVWSRFASFIEVGGRTGLGYRDTAQDVMNVPHLNRGRVRTRLIELLRAQTSTGYGLHLFDPEALDPGRPLEESFVSPTVVPGSAPREVVHGLEDACSDDTLWLVPSVCEYVKETGDGGFFELPVRFADGGEASVYEHLKRAVDFSAEQVGRNGICKGLRADWNDCLNLGGGESAMVSFLHYWALQSLIEAAEFLGREHDATAYRAMAERVRRVCEAHLWDGEWYLRGITETGRYIGSHECPEGKIHLESNALAVLSGAASSERARCCMDAVYRYLFSEHGLHLVWPCFSQPDDEVGFVTRVYPGIKENGSIFSHPNPWAVVAECRMGRGLRAMELFDALLPCNYNDRAEVRQAEPYSYCQFVMGRDHAAHGRARHPWLTGSAGWAYAAATHWILGIRPGYHSLTVDPCIPPRWRGFEVQRQWRGATYRIRIENPHGVEKGVESITIDGERVEGQIPVPSGKRTEYRVTVVMG